jgi:hypothetical protein
VRAGDDVLLVLPPGSAKVDVRIDERGRKYASAFGMHVAPRSEPGNHPLLDRDREGLVDALPWVDDPDSLENDVVLVAVLGE